MSFRRNIIRSTSILLLFFAASMLRPGTATFQTNAADLPEEYRDACGQEFRLIPAGSFMMGNTMTPEEINKKYPGGVTKDYEESPVHKVTLTRSYYIGKYPVTKGEFAKFVEATGYKTTAEKKGSAITVTKDGDADVKGINWRAPGFEQTDKDPVVCVSYEDAQAYISWLNENAKSAKELDGQKPEYCLPTEAEWENAARAGTEDAFFWSDEPVDGKGYMNGMDESLKNDPAYVQPFKQGLQFPFDDGYQRTSPVDCYKPNPWGVYDMLGNVLEWCDDWYGDYEKNAVVDPQGPSEGSARVLRGGSWGDFPAYCRCAHRYDEAPSFRGTFCGFRLAFRLTK